MKRFLILMLIALMFAGVAGATEPVEPPKKCKQCGMDRTAFARSRMLIVYDDGTSVGTCSILCVAEELRQQGHKPVKSLLVADYATEELIPAKSAVWVVGGVKKGGMNYPPKWAFARKGDALQFIRENGGDVTAFDQVMKSAIAAAAEAARIPQLPED